MLSFYTAIVEKLADIFRIRTTYVEISSPDVFLKSLVMLVMKGSRDSDVEVELCLELYTRFTWRHEMTESETPETCIGNCQVASCCGTHQAALIVSPLQVQTGGYKRQSCMTSGITPDI